MGTTRSRYFKATVLTLATTLAAALSACDLDYGPSPETGAVDQEALPDWIVNVRPEPGAQQSTLKLVQVEHEVPTGAREVRLLIDGVDVTTAANFGAQDRSIDGERVTGPGHLLFDPVNDPQAANSRVILDAGEHTATAQLVELEEFGGSETVVDEFTWSFSIK